jgi:transketolase C-terminal domain/subunit
MCNVASENLGLGVHSLKIKSDQRAGKEVTILDHNTIVSLGDDVHSSLLEVGETTVGDLDITVYGDGARSLISLVTNEITTDQVDAATWKTDKSSEFLIKAIGD